MADPAKLIARIRDLGANVMVDGDRLEIVNKHKLPAGALDFIKKNARAVGELLIKEAEFEERAAKIEYGSGCPREMAEEFARICIAARPEGWTDLDHSWFITRCGQIIDAAGETHVESKLARAA